MSVPPSSSDETEAVLENIKEDGSFDRLRQQLLSLLKASVSYFVQLSQSPPPPGHVARFSCHLIGIEKLRIVPGAAGLPGAGAEADGRQRHETVINRGRSGRSADDGAAARR